MPDSATSRRLAQSTSEHLTLEVSDEGNGYRVDQFLVSHLGHMTRSQIQKLIKDGHLKVDGKKAKPKDLLRGFEEIEINYLEEPSIEDKPEDINLDIIIFLAI